MKKSEALACIKEFLERYEEFDGSQFNIPVDQYQMKHLLTLIYNAFTGDEDEKV